MYLYNYKPIFLYQIFPSIFIMMNKLSKLFKKRQGKPNNYRKKQQMKGQYSILTKSKTIFKLFLTQI